MKYVIKKSVLKVMKQVLYYILAIVFGLWSCNNQSAERKTGQILADTLQTISVNNQNIYIKDQTQYDQIFIQGLANYNEPIKLINNYILTGQDTTFFPSDLQLNKKTTFHGANDSAKFTLTVTRTNLTNLNYKFQISDKSDKIVETKSGKAILGSMFFLASEVDEDDQTGTAYGSYEYSDKMDNGCWFAIRIGIGLDDNGKQRATLSYNCEDENKKTTDLDECPILRTE